MQSGPQNRTLIFFCGKLAGKLAGTSKLSPRYPYLGRFHTDIFYGDNRNYVTETLPLSA